VVEKCDGFTICIRLLIGSLGTLRGSITRVNFRTFPFCRPGAGHVFYRIFSLTAPNPLFGFLPWRRAIRCLRLRFWRSLILEAAHFPLFGGGLPRGSTPQQWSCGHHRGEGTFGFLVDRLRAREPRATWQAPLKAAEFIALSDTEQSSVFGSDSRNFRGWFWKAAPDAGNFPYRRPADSNAFPARRPE